MLRYPELPKLCARRRRWIVSLEFSIISDLQPSDWSDHESEGSHENAIMIPRWSLPEILPFLPLGSSHDRHLKHLWLVGRDGVSDGYCTMTGPPIVFIRELLRGSYGLGRARRRIF